MLPYSLTQWTRLVRTALVSEYAAVLHRHGLVSHETIVQWQEETEKRATQTRSLATTMAPVVLNGFVEAELIDARAVVAWWRARERDAHAGRPGAPSGRGGGGKGGCNVPLMVHAAARQLVEEFEAQGFGGGAAAPS